LNVTRKKNHIEDFINEISKCSSFRVWQAVYAPESFMLILL